jgi:hypothetical protein
MIEIHNSNMFQKIELPNEERIKGALNKEINNTNSWRLQHSAMPHSVSLFKFTQFQFIVRRNPSFQIRKKL